MATLLAELLHDVSRRAGEIHSEFTRLKGEVPLEVEPYRQEMERRANHAKRLADEILADPDLVNPILAVNYFRDFRDIARFVQGLENLPLLVLRRFNDRDLLLTRLVRAVCAEVKYPYSTPVCSSLSAQYYWTVAGMDLVFVPTLEPERLLGLADIYHELGHIVLFREEKRILIPGLALIDKHFDAVVAQGRLAGWAQNSLDEVEEVRHRWRTAWLLEFGSDFIATYLCGPSFGWCNIRTSTNLGGEIFRGNESHPADDSRAVAIGIMLNRLGENQASEEIAHRWQELVTLSGESKPARFDLTYPSGLLEQLCELIFASCKAIGLEPWGPAQKAASLVTQTLDAAWTQFRLSPDSFDGYERAELESLLQKLST